MYPEPPYAAVPTPFAVDRIITDVLADVAARESRVSFSDIKAQSRSMPPPRDGLAALHRAGCSIIPELKRAVPYVGEINPVGSAHDMARLAESFAEAGAHLLAVQTDKRRFHGSLADMAAARAATDVPMVCRDIIVDPYQIHEARCYGADIVPLQVELLEPARLESLLDRIESLGMTALLEVRSCAEADLALKVGAKVIGINAWTLASDALYREAFNDIVPGLPESVYRIAIGGVDNPSTVLSFASRGADAVVVGASVMSAADPTAMVRTLVATGQHPACPRRAH